MQLQATALLGHDEDMVKRYLSFTQVSEKLDITKGALGTLDMPAPDAVIGEGPRATRGWLEKTIDDWDKSRPGSGNWGKKAPAKKQK